MKSISRLFLAAAAIVCAACSSSNGYDVYLLLGQSNMAGRGSMLPEDTVEIIDGVWLLNAEGVPEPAVSPLNKYSSIRKEIGMQQICPGDRFSEEMYKATGRKILLVVNARGGSSLSEWMKDSPEQDYFEEAVKRAGQAAGYGKIKAVLWHQGESDSGRSDVYLDSLVVFVSDLRKAIGDESVPFIAGEIAHWTDNADTFNEMISHISGRIPNSFYVSSEGCTPLKDVSDPHFSRNGQMLLGHRYACKVLEAEGLRNPQADTLNKAVSDIDWAHTDTGLAEGPLAQQAVDVFRQGLKYTVNDWYGSVKKFGEQTGRFLDFGGTTEHFIRPVSHQAFALAVALRFNVYDADITGKTAEEARSMAIRLISSLAGNHKAVKGEETGWGNEWQSAWWASQTAFAAWLLWDDLDAGTRNNVYDMTVYEAGRFTGYRIPYYRDRNGKVIYKGDSKSEENAWNSDLLVLAGLMFPNHPDAGLWLRMATELQVSAYARPSDMESSRTVSGLQLDKFLEGSNLEENGTVINHGLIHVDYMVAFMQNAINTLPYFLLGKPAEEASLFNGGIIYDALNNLSFNGQTMYVRDSAGKATSTVFFPEGNDWGTKKQANYWLMDIIAHCFHLDKGMSPTASEWAYVRGEKMKEMQMRNPDGTSYQGKEDGFPSREEFLLAEVAFGYLFLWADENGMIRLTDES